MHGTRLRLHRLEKRLREYMLTGVLLHVVESPRPVDRAGHGACERCGDQVEHAVLTVFDHVRHRYPTQRTGIVRLAAGRRIEGGAVEDHRQSVAMGLRREHGRVELREVAISVVQPLCHGPPERKGIKAAATACSSAA